MEPLKFIPVYQTRVWGGRTLETKYQRPLPDDQPYGESWEISDRSEAQSIVDGGPFSGKTLHHLWTHHRKELFGDGLQGDRFPLLIKILDCRDDLSIQVHPPAPVARELGGEAKTEMWYIADAVPDSKLYVGFKEGVTRETFETALQDGSVEEIVHAISPEIGESIFLESGRLHAIGAGFLIFEIQENSDTTYRVFDWNRTGLNGKPRDLHVQESLKSINFDDTEPSMDIPQGNTLASCPLFTVEKHTLASGQSCLSSDHSFAIISIIRGSLHSPEGSTYHEGDFFIIPKNGSPLTSQSETVILKTTIPRS